MQPVAELAAVAREAGVPLHVDAVQAAGQIPVDVRALGADLVALSGHKVGGPKGVGALWVRPGHALEPLVPGGGQERGRRSGTQNVAGAAGFAAAFEEAEAERAAAADAWAELRDRFAARVLVGVRELVGQLLAIPLGQASNGDDLLGAAVLLEIGSLEQGVDRVLLRLLDEATGVDDGHIGLGSVVDEGPALGLQPAGQFLGIDLVAGAAQGHEGDRALGTAHGGHVVTLVASGASATHGTVLP